MCKWSPLLAHFHKCSKRKRPFAHSLICTFSHSHICTLTQSFFPMRIITGKYKGRHFEVPRTFKARPTTDFAKENLFNVLRAYVDFEDVTALDLFGGTGSISLELVSRGCQRVTSFSSANARWAMRLGCPCVAMPCALSNAARSRSTSSLPTLLMHSPN